ncbi:MAG TPA: hypothetical protein VJ476_10035 [Rhizomicrobium sp.]|nr:hypothetical protein [Rhizomicrobium sp.]
MAASARPLFEAAFEAPAETAPSQTLANFARLHMEAVETARLANLLGRSLYAIIAFAALAVLTLAVAGSIAASSIAWAILTGAGVLAMARTWRHAIDLPFERPTLQAFSQDLHACLLYAGFVWGAGAFLALPAATNGIEALLFVAAPAVTFAVLLRERQIVLQFVAPAAALTSLACAVRPFADGAYSAAIALGAGAIAAWAVNALTRSHAKGGAGSLNSSAIAL